MVKMGDVFCNLISVVFMGRKAGQMRGRMQLKERKDKKLTPFTVHMEQQRRGWCVLLNCHRGKSLCVSLPVSS